MHFLLMSVVTLWHCTIFSMGSSPSWHSQLKCGKRSQTNYWTFQGSQRVLYNGLRAFNFWFYPPTWIDFWLFIGIEVQSMLFAKCFFALGLYDGLRASTYWLHSPTWVGFWLFISVEVQLRLLIYFVCFIQKY